MAFERIMVGLDFTEMDQNILSYTQMIRDLFKPEIIYFVHAEEDLDLPEDVLNELGLDKNNPADESLESRLNETVGEYFQSTPETKIDTKIVEGSAFEEMLHWSHIKKVDLLIVGKKHRENGKGVLPQKLTRKVDASVIFVPEDYETKSIERILTPLDFSENSAKAVRTIDELFGTKSVKVFGAHCYHLPLGWYKTGKSEEEFNAIMREHAENRFGAFFEKLDDLSMPVQAHYALDRNDDPSEEIMEFADELDIDLIVIGARGKSDAATILLGSTTEKLVIHDKHIPLLVVKEKGQTIGFLEALFKLK